jgi:cyclic beta-1,2-glucan synthetase
MVDNLRRSLTAPSAFLVAVAAWILPAVPPLLWTGLFVGSIAVPSFIPVFDGIVPRRWGISKRSHLRAVGHDVFVALSQALLAVVMLAHQAWLSGDAVVRTFVRLYVTKRHLLEWVPAEQAGYGADLRLRAFYWNLRGGVVLAGAADSVSAVCRSTISQTLTPDRMRGRMSSVFSLVVASGPRLGESMVLAVARAYEQVTDWHKRMPSMN